MNYFPAATDIAIERFPTPPTSQREHEDAWSGGKAPTISSNGHSNGSLPARPATSDGNGTLALEHRNRSRELVVVTARVLVVDDDAGVLEVVIRMLRAAGYQVCGASDGEAGWDVLTTHRFDLLVTDHDMPRLSGLGLLRRVRASVSSLPVILISGRMPWEEPDLSRLLLPGCALTKPFAMAALLAAARELLVPTAPPAPGNDVAPNRLNQAAPAPESTRQVD